MFTLDGQTYPLRDLADTLGLPRTGRPAPRAAARADRQPVAGRHVALAVDEIVNSRDAVVKTLGTHLRRVPGVWGATLLGDGTVVLILNPADLAGAADEPRSRMAADAPPAAENEPYNVLIVDDSLSMRHVLSVAVKQRRLERDAGARRPRGARARRIARRVRPISSCSTSRCRGWTASSSCRRSARRRASADLPIVMLTSRGGDKHRDKAKALGATDYMVKPFQEDTLVSNIDRLVQAVAAGRPEGRLMIRVAIADDSPFTCKLLASYLEEGGDCRVVGIAHDAQSTIELISARTSPDVLTLDLQMPGGDGLDLLRELADEPPVSVVVISGVTRLAAATTLRALELGAVDFVLKYTPGAPVSRASLRREIVAKVKAAAAAHPATARRRPRSAAARRAAAAPVARRPRVGRGPRDFGRRRDRDRRVDGRTERDRRAARPAARRLRRRRCVIVQHLPASFTAPFAAQLSRHTRCACAWPRPATASSRAWSLVAPGRVAPRRPARRPRLDLQTPAANATSIGRRSTSR